MTLARSASDLDDLTLSFAGSGSVFLNEQFNSKYYGVDFADGTSWSRAAMLDAVLRCGCASARGGHAGTA